MWLGQNLNGSGIFLFYVVSGSANFCLLFSKWLRHFLAVYGKKLKSGSGQFLKWLQTPEIFWQRW
jgi:hypothetical protein